MEENKKSYQEQDKKSNGFFNTWISGGKPAEEVKKPAAAPNPAPVKPTSFGSDPKPVLRTAATPVRPAAPVRSKSVVAEGMAIKGDIVCKGDVDVQGDILGNISAEGFVLVTGRVVGSIVAESVEVSGGEVTGEHIKAKNNVKIGKDVVMSAQLAASNIVIDGKVTGNLTAKESVTISESAVVKGNINAMYISVARGAQLDGRFVSVEKEKAAEAAAAPAVAPAAAKAEPAKPAEPAK